MISQSEYNAIMYGWENGEPPPRDEEPFLPTDLSDAKKEAILREIQEAKQAPWRHGLPPEVVIA